MHWRDDAQAIVDESLFCAPGSLYYPQAATWARQHYTLQRWGAHRGGANDGLKSLVRFDLSAIPTGKTVDEAILRLYYKGRSNSNDLTIGGPSPAGALGGQPGHVDPADDRHELGRAWIGQRIGL
jgi:hypothetical protein